MIGKPVVQLVAAVVVGVFALGILLSGDDVEVGWLRFYSVAVAAALLSLWVWEHLLWHVSWMQRLKLAPPDVRGTWRGALASQWINPQTGKQIAPKTAFLVVRQTFSRTTVTLITDESVSHSSLALVRTANGTAGIDYMYQNKPRSSVEDRSRMHHGSASLSITGRPATRLHGWYWTDRDTRGELHFGRRSEGFADDFDGAEALFTDG